MNRTVLSYLFLFLLLWSLAIPVRSADAGEYPFVGEIAWVAFYVIPNGWARCDGQLMSISQNTTLFSLLGTQYGGDGISTFALPDMQGRVPISTNYGEAQQLSSYFNGDSGGEEYHTLISSEIPSHNHTLKASTNSGTVTSPADAYFGAATSGTQYGSEPAVSMYPLALNTAGSSQPHNNMMPYTTLYCIIAQQGVFPPRP
jgi:microcystin-dependent protein